MVVSSGEEHGHENVFDFVDDEDLENSCYQQTGSFANAIQCDSLNRRSGLSATPSLERKLSSHHHVKYDCKSL